MSQIFEMKRGAMGSPRAAENASIFVTYFSELLTVVKVPLSAVPRPLTAAMMAMAMPVAIRPYSIAVAPDSFFRKLAISSLMMTCSSFSFQGT